VGEAARFLAAPLALATPPVLRFTCRVPHGAVVFLRPFGRPVAHSAALFVPAVLNFNRSASRTPSPDAGGRVPADRRSEEFRRTAL